MKDKIGFLKLKVVTDYWEKVLHDYELFISNSDDTYCAYNFFVTIHHLTDWYIDWKYQTNPDVIRKELGKFQESNAILRICDHVATFAKHVKPTAKKHIIVDDIHNDYFAPGYVVDDYASGLMMIELTSGESMEAIYFAEKAVNFWKNYLEAEGII